MIINKNFSFLFIIFVSLNIVSVLSEGTIPKCRTKAKTNIICSSSSSSSSLSSLKDNICKSGKNIYLVDDSGLLICKMPKKNDRKHNKRYIISRDGSDDGEVVTCNVENGTDCLSNTYYLIGHSLYYCKTENTKCDEITDVGYYIYDREKAYVCRKSGISISCSSSSITRINAVANCSGNNGKVVYIGTTEENKVLSICLSEDKAIKINNANAGNYVVKGESDIFGVSSGKYAIVTVKEKSVTLNTSYSNELKYIYVNKASDKDTTTFRVMDKGDTCPKNGAGNDIEESNILELEYDDNNGTWSEVALI